ncbi:hypothetical protein Tco_1214385 [Tanacetum coccineum]
MKDLLHYILTFGYVLKSLRFYISELLKLGAFVKRRNGIKSDDDLEPAEAQALPAPVSPAPLSPDYSEDSEPIEDDPQEAEEDPEEESFKEEELPALAASTPAIADPASPSEEIEPFEEDEIAPTPPSPTSHHIFQMS